MDLKKLNQEIKKLNLPEIQTEGILELINLKVTSDMENAVNRIESSMDKLNHKLEASIDSLKEGNSNIKWVVGISSGAIGILITILGLIFTFKK